MSDPRDKVKCLRCWGEGEVYMGRGAMVDSLKFDFHGEDLACLKDIVSKWQENSFIPCPDCGGRGYYVNV